MSAAGSAGHVISGQHAVADSGVIQLSAMHSEDGRICTLQDQLHCMDFCVLCFSGKLAGKDVQGMNVVFATEVPKDSLCTS